MPRPNIREDMYDGDTHYIEDDYAIGLKSRDDDAEREMQDLDDDLFADYECLDPWLLKLREFEELEGSDY